MAFILTIILNWNCAKDTMEAVDSVIASETVSDSIDIFLVDNGSTDDSAIVLEKYFSQKCYEVIEVKRLEDVKIDRKGTKKIFFYKSKENLGFTGGNNVGFRFALMHGYDFVFLLNADATVDKDCIMTCGKCLAQPEIGIVGPKIYYYDYYGKRDVITFAGGIIDKKTGKVTRLGKNQIANDKRFDKNYQVDYIEGSALMVKTHVLEKIGFFDESYYLYWEDTDLCARAREKGYKVIYVGNAIAWHKDKPNVGDKITPKYIYYITRNRLLWAKKHSSFLERMCVILHSLYILVRKSVSHFVRKPQHKKTDNLLAMIYAHIDFFTMKFGKTHRY